MYSRKVNKTEFANLMLEWKPGKKAYRDLFRARPEHSPDDGELWLCWPNEDSGTEELPRLAIVSDKSLMDFFGWSITFLPAYRPLTSFIRVLPWSVFTTYQNQKPSHSIEKKSVLVSLILAETLTNGVGRGFLESLPMTAYETTYSYAASRAMSLGYEEAALAYIYNAWQSAREFDNRGRRLPADLLFNFWNSVPLILTSSNYRSVVGESGMTVDLLKACEEISERGQISINSLERLSSGKVPPHLFIETARMPKEQRVVAFENTIRHLAFGPPGEPAVNFVVGYLASLVSDGSLEHSQLLFPFQAQFPTAMLWYGVCAALSPVSRILTDYGHLGLKILRMLERSEDILSAPTCDISLAELEVMFRGQPRSRSFQQTHASSVRVELAPGVTTVTRPIGNQSSVEQPSLFSEENTQPKFEPQRLKELVQALRNSLFLAESLISNSSNPDSGNDVQSRNKRKR